MKHRAWLCAVTVIFVSATTCSVRGQSSDNDTTNERASYLWSYNGESYGFFQLGGMSFSDSVRTQRWLGMRFGGDLVDHRLAAEVEVYLIRIIQLRGRDGHHRLAATPLAQAGTWIALHYLLKPIDSNLAKYGAMLGFMMGGTDLAFHFDDAVQLYGGVRPDLLLFSHQDGVLFQSHVGLRIIPRKRLTLSVEAVHNSFWGFDDDSRDLDWGFGIYLSGNCGPGGCFD
jgi:hypothetical protein